MSHPQASAISKIDIYRSAQVLVKQHGEDAPIEDAPIEAAPIEAAMRADAMLEGGDLDGYAVWRQILRAVEVLQRVEPGSGVQVH